MSNKKIDNTERLKQLAKELRESNEIKRFYGNNFTEGSKYCVVSEAELIPTAEAIEEVLAEREQQDKRIQELEEESRKKSIELICYQEELENSIPKQVVIEAISVHQDYLLNQATTSNPNLDASFRDRERYAIQVLQELLQESEDK